MKIFRYIAFLLIIYGTPLFGTMAELWRAAEAGDRSPVAVELFRKVNEWKYKNGIEIIQEVLPEEVVVTRDDIEGVLKHCGNILCARIFVLNGEALETHNVPFIFISGERTSDNINDNIRQFIRNITDYSFLSSSGESFAHSERAFALSLLKENWYRELFLQYQNIHSYIIQIHNITHPMCNMCKNFFLCKSPYIIMDEMGFFVMQSYEKWYQAALPPTRMGLTFKGKWLNFLNINIASISITTSMLLKELYGLFWELKGKKDDINSKRAFYQDVRP